MVELNGQVKAIHVENTKAATLQKEIYETVAEGSNLFTDEHRSYHSIGREYNHRSVNHNKGEYVYQRCS
jgi:transposase-like protein